MKKKWFGIVLLLAQVLLLSAQSADQIVEKSRNRIKADTISSRLRMVLFSKDGSTSERLIDQYSIDTKDGNRTLIMFQAPSSIAGNRFLIAENKTGEDGRWTCSPSKPKARRIFSGESSGSFMGTDFSYDDLSLVGTSTSKDTHSILREETYRDAACWVIESKAKDSSSQYAKKIIWIGKDNSIIYKTELYNKKDELVKQLDLLDMKDVQGRLTPMRMKMSTIKAGTSTEIQVEIMRYDDNIPESRFTTDFLEKWRPQ